MRCLMVAFLTNSGITLTIPGCEPACLRHYTLPPLNSTVDVIFEKSFGGFQIIETINL